jgi:hypothetical protein
MFVKPNQKDPFNQKEQPKQKEKTWQQLQLENLICDYVALYSYCYQQIEQKLPEDADKNFATATIFAQIVRRING